MPRQNKNNPSYASGDGLLPQVKTVAGSRRPSSKPFWLLTLAALIILAVVGGWTLHTMKEGLRSDIESALRSIVNANVAAVEIWLKSETEFARNWAREPHLQAQVQALLDFEKDSRRDNSIIAEAYANEIKWTLSSLEGKTDYLGFDIVKPSGQILASSLPSATGKQLNATGMELVSRVLAGESVIFETHKRGSLIVGVTAAKDESAMIAFAPILTEDGSPLALLAIEIDPDLDFTRILSVGQAGKTGETYAFDEQGRMLSDSRFDSQLRKIGLLPADPEVRATLNIQIRDPGGDLTRGYRTDEPPENWPLTRMARLGVAGISGVDVDGYRDYRGVEVYGAWVWLSDYGFGVVTEMEKTEALALLKPLQRAFTGLFGALVGAALFLFFSTFFIQHLRNRIHTIEQLGQYTLEHRIGEGGMGKVYKASHALLRRPTAIKLINKDEAHPDDLARFEKEVQATSQLTHPNTIAIYDYGHTPEGIFYYAMEYLSGIHLGQLIIIEKQVVPARVVHILKQICGSLAEAHDSGLIHRDIKPANVILCKRGGQFDVVKVLDFGLVKEISSPEELELTGSQAIPGTPGFIAPERLQPGQTVDARADLYAVGALGFFLLTGQQVHPCDTPAEAAYHAVNTAPQRPSERLGEPLSCDLDELIHLCLAQNPDLRPQSAQEIIEIFESIEHSTPWSQEEAQTWWQANEPHIRFQKNLSRPDSSLTDQTDLRLGIDLGERGV